MLSICIVRYTVIHVYRHLEIKCGESERERERERERVRKKKKRTFPLLMLLVKNEECINRMSDFVSVWVWDAKKVEKLSFACYIIYYYVPANPVFFSSSFFLNFTLQPLLVLMMDRNVGSSRGKRASELETKQKMKKKTRREKWTKAEIGSSFLFSYLQKRMCSV